mmetsp:Transcript_22023/g.61726  ORF Transcript_22023/g.61726 Transcript_22023/m.61726 type:complete len:219 (+) Transcript_22023:209-865(+)
MRKIFGSFRSLPAAPPEVRTSHGKLVSRSKRNQVLRYIRLLSRMRMLASPRTTGAMKKLSTMSAQKSMSTATTVASTHLGVIHHTKASSKGAIIAVNSTAQIKTRRHIRANRLEGKITMARRSSRRCFTVVEYFLLNIISSNPTSSSSRLSCDWTSRFHDCLTQACRSARLLMRKKFWAPRGVDACDSFDFDVCTDSVAANDFVESDDCIRLASYEIA